MPSHPDTDAALAARRTVIQLRNILKTFGAGPDKALVLRGVNADVRAGEFVTIMGPSGAGKTTLLSIIGMLDSSWTGEYLFLGKAVHKLSQKERIELHKLHIGFVFQQYHLIDSLTVYENLEIPLTYRNTPRKEREATIAATMERFGLTGKKGLYPTKLSGGIQQIIGVARAVIANPK